MATKIPGGMDVATGVAAICAVGGLLLAVKSEYGADAEEEERRKVRLLEIEELRNDRQIEALEILKSNSALKKKTADGGGGGSKTNWWWSKPPSTNADS